MSEGSPNYSVYILMIPYCIIVTVSASQQSVLLNCSMLTHLVPGIFSPQKSTLYFPKQSSPHTQYQVFNSAVRGTWMSVNTQLFWVCELNVTTLTLICGVAWSSNSVYWHLSRPVEFSRLAGHQSIGHQHGKHQSDHSGLFIISL